MPPHVGSCDLEGCTTDASKPNVYMKISEKTMAGKLAKADWIPLRGFCVCLSCYQRIASKGSLMKAKRSIKTSALAALGLAAPAPVPSLAPPPIVDMIDGDGNRSSRPAKVRVLAGKWLPGAEKHTRALSKRLRWELRLAARACLIAHSIRGKGSAILC